MDFLSSFGTSMTNDMKLLIWNFIVSLFIQKFFLITIGKKVNEFPGGISKFNLLFMRDL